MKSYLSDLQSTWSRSRSRSYFWRAGAGAGAEKIERLRNTDIKARGPGGNGCWEEKLKLSKKGEKDKEGKRGKEKEEMKERKGKARE